MRLRFFFVSQNQRMLTEVTLIGCFLSLCFTDHYEGEVLFSTERNLTIDHQELVQVKKRYRFSLFSVSSETQKEQI